MSGFCERCGELSWPDGHVCFQFRVWCPDDGASEASARPIWARTLRQAIEKWAAREDADGQGGIAEGRTSPLVRACRVGETPRTLRVTGKYEAVYDCEEVEDE